MTRIIMLAFVGILTALCGAAGQEQDKSVEAVPLKYDGLKQEVLKQRGKVLVVDFWSGT